MLATFALALVLAGPAASGTRQQTTQKILSDLADNGRLDRRYTPTQIYRALDSLETYEKERRERKRRPRSPRSNRRFPPTVRRCRSAVSTLRCSAPSDVPLLLIGASLGRLVRVKPQGEPG